MPEPGAKKTAAVAEPRGWNRPIPDLNKIIRRAERGDKAALGEVKEMLERAGAVDMLGGNVAREALRRLVKSACGDNSVIREATDRKFDQMRADLLGANPTALERLLVERVVATWYHLHHLEVLYAGKTEFTIASGLYWQKCMSAAQKRYLAAIKGLSEVRKLAIPALQVNIARKQVNVAGSSAAG